MGKIIFIVGTDTGVGKTLFACGLVITLLKEKKSAIALKPIETGFAEPNRSDACLLSRASKRELDDVILYKFKNPLAPLAAAELEGKKVDFKRIASWISEKAKENDFTFVETAGGLMVPITEDSTYLDLIAELNAPAVIVARNTLGTINHTLLTFQTLASRGIPTLGVILNEPNGPDHSSETNPSVISRFVPTSVARFKRISGVENDIEALFERRDFIAQFWLIMQGLFKG